MKILGSWENNISNPVIDIASPGMWKEILELLLILIYLLLL